MKTLIIGGGSAGYHLAAKTKATIIEEHDTIGSPVACTGLVTDEILKFYSEKELRPTILNKLNHTTIALPKNNLEFELNDYVLCNNKFVQLLAAKAHQNGSETLLKHHYVANSHNKARIKDRTTGNTKIIKFDKLIGADGPHSKVAKNNNLAQKRKHVIGVQTVRKHQMPQSVHFYPSIAEYAWAVPESKNKIRVGLCTRNNNAVAQFSEFALRYPGADLDNISGTIPLHAPRQKVEKSNISVIGDAALQTKNTTGGGIIAGIKAAEAHATGRYQKNLGTLNKELYFHYLANKTLNKYTNKDWNKLAQRAADPKIKKILSETNRDNLMSIMTKIAVKKPSALASVWPIMRF